MKTMPRKGAADAMDAATFVPSSPYAAFRLVAYQFGVERLADRMGLRPGTLYNKADADAESHAQPTLRDVMALTRETGDTRVLESLDRMFDRVGVDVTPGAPASDEALLELLLKVGSEQGALCGAVHHALQDARFTREELERVKGEAHDLICAVLAFVQRLEGLTDE